MGCPELIRDGRYCERHKKETAKQIDDRRGTAVSRGYDGRWQKARHSYLLHHPLCVTCQAEGRIKAANVVDHIIPHKGDKQVFWDISNWQSLCKQCHDIKTAKEDGRWGRGE
jgi:5-methylcytosine-specific restriction protein A